MAHGVLGTASLALMPLIVVMVVLLVGVVLVLLLALGPRCGLRSGLGPETGSRWRSTSSRMCGVTVLMAGGVHGWLLGCGDCLRAGRGGTGSLLCG